MIVRSGLPEIRPGFGARGLFFFFYAVMAWVFLWQWGSPDPASRIDRFTVGFFVLLPFRVAENLFCYRSIEHSTEVEDEALGRTFDPAFIRWAALLRFAELGVFMEYGHWRFVPGLARQDLQWIGLLLWGVVPIWLLWADLQFVPHFRDADSGRRLITQGPYDYVRHPRYAGALASAVGLALMFASVLAWVLVMLWLVLLLRRIALEERQLCSQYGQEYAAYAARTPRLIPGLF